MIMQLYMILHNNTDNLPYLDMRQDKSSATVVSVLGRAINFSCTVHTHGRVIPHMCIA